MYSCWGVIKTRTSSALGRTSQPALPASKPGKMIFLTPAKLHHFGKTEANLDPFFTCLRAKGHHWAAPCSEAHSHALRASGTSERIPNTQQ